MQSAERSKSSNDPGNQPKEVSVMQATSYKSNWVVQSAQRSMPSKDQSLGGGGEVGALSHA